MHVSFCTLRPTGRPPVLVVVWVMRSLIVPATRAFSLVPTFSGAAGLCNAKQGLTRLPRLHTYSSSSRPCRPLTAVADSRRVEAYDVDAGRNLWEAIEDDTGEGSSEMSETYGSLPVEDDNDLEPSLLEDPTDQNPLVDEYYRWKEALAQCVAALQKKQRSLQAELEKADKVEETVQRAELITSNMYLFPPGVRTATLTDWNQDGAEVECTLNDAYDSASAEADALFQQARKLKRGSKIVGPLLADIDAAQESLDEIQLDLEAALSDDTVNENILRLVQDRLLRSVKNTGFRVPTDTHTKEGGKKQQSSNGKRRAKAAVGTPASNLRKLTSPGGCNVIVGRNRKGNEYLTFNIARGDDIWMHARGCPGAHVLIQQRRGSPEATDACIQFAADLTIFYSDARAEKSFDVTTGEPKHLLKPRGAPLGAVKLRQELGNLVGHPDDVPDECKLARDESGQESEYRFQDKAKHRKRTKLAVKQQSEKRRAAAKSKKKKRSDA